MSARPACVAALLLLPVTGAMAAAASPGPNFVFIYTDDQRWDALGVVQRELGPAARFPWFQTPNLDRLARDGVRFRNAFVVNSLCSPSRATFLTGCYGYLNGVVNNHTDFPVDNVTHASLLRAAGYVTGYVGKWHMGRQSGPRPGFDFSASFIGQGQYFDCPFEIDGQSTPTKGWVDDVSTEYALEFLRKNRAKPFLLALGFKTCHGPFTPPPRTENLYPDELARSTPNFHTPAIYLGEERKRQIAEAEKAERVKTNMGCFRGLAAVDENVGRLMAALDELKLSENTVVVFTSDNGYYLGEHGLGDKRSAYDESLRIPLLLRYPKLGVKGKVIDQVVLNTDLAPTFVDFAGLDVPARMQGRSWRALLEGRAAGWRKAFFYTYFGERGFTTPTTQAVRTETAKLICYPGYPQWTELFDLKADPYETRNLYEDPAHAALRTQMEAEFDGQARAVEFRFPEFADKPKSDAGPPALGAWVLDYRFDRDDGDKVVDASGKGNHGQAHAAPLAEGRQGHKARRFDGRGHIEVPKSDSLRPNVSGWTIEIVLKPEKASGVVLARGGRSAGYCLYLDEGRPVFAVTVNNRLFEARAKRPIATGAWTEVSARITADKRLALSVDGKPAGSGKLRDFIDRDPNNTMQIGADLGSPVVEGKSLPKFEGLIESLRMYSGEAP